MQVLDELQGRAGSEIGVSDWLAIDQERIDAFADATNDHQWIHVDRERAAAGPFGAPIAHGFLTLSLIPDLAPAVVVPGVKMAINYGLDRVRFISPVVAGTRVRARTKLLSAHEVAGGIQVKSEVTIEIEGGEKPACVAETLARFYL